ncbi:hypothetical protein Nepgr_000858 [Nepenthes gracilis]|uniref:Complex III subunit VII n=1 Tax=Nepenthes gracilis TaxID=150966 RepID=A0AAD3P764_NEPGR|nr:hypothetical protein Nepgr_000858 [Nepenthes gracilis]
MGRSCVDTCTTIWPDYKHLADMKNCWSGRKLAGVSKELAGLKESVMNRGDNRNAKKLDPKSTLTLTYLSGVLKEDHASFVETVPFKQIAAFTLPQLVYFLVCFGVTWIPRFEIVFPMWLFLLISIRELFLPKLFLPHYLQELDVIEYEEIVGVSRYARSILATDGTPPESPSTESKSPLLNEEDTLDRITIGGEFKFRTVGFYKDKPSMGEDIEGLFGGSAVMAASPFVRWLVDPRRNFLAAFHKKTLDKRLRKYGLRLDDLYDPLEDLDIKEALNRLPREIVDARNQRLKRAMDLSMKHEYLPEDLQTMQTPFRSYLQDMLALVKRERAEREALGALPLYQRTIP